RPGWTRSTSRRSAWSCTFPPVWSCRSPPKMSPSETRRTKKHLTASVQIRYPLRGPAPPPHDPPFQPAIDSSRGPQMRFDLVTLFPGFFESTLRYGILERALRSNLAAVHTHDLRNWTHDRHRTVDDRPFGGGEGMVLKPQPIFEC